MGLQVATPRWQIQAGSPGGDSCPVSPTGSCGACLGPRTSHPGCATSTKSLSPPSWQVPLPPTPVGRYLPSRDPGEARDACPKSPRQLGPHPASLLALRPSKSQCSGFKARPLKWGQKWGAGAAVVAPLWDPREGVPWGQDRGGRGPGACGLLGGGAGGAGAASGRSCVLRLKHLGGSTSSAASPSADASPGQAPWDVWTPRSGRQVEPAAPCPARGPLPAAAGPRGSGHFPAGRPPGRR